MPSNPILALLACLLPVADDLPTVRSHNQSLPASVAPAVGALMDKASYTVVEEGKDVAHLWVRAHIPVTGKKDLPSYDLMTEGTLVAVVEIMGDMFTDFREQKLPPGIYTMRFGIQPQDGNHMGVAPFPEFLCLSPVAHDTKVDPIGHKELMELSKKAAGAGHPTVMFMQPFMDKPAVKFPSITTNESSHVILNVMSKATLPDKKVVDFPFAIVIVGVTEAK